MHTHGEMVLISHSYQICEDRKIILNQWKMLQPESCKEHRDIWKENTWEWHTLFFWELSIRISTNIQCREGIDTFSSFQLLVLCFYMISVCMNVSISLSICIPWVFPLLLFSLFVLSYYGLFVLMLYYCFHTSFSILMRDRV